MTVICEECGKVYHVDPDKVEQYKGRNVRVRCNECGHVTQLTRLLETAESPAEPVQEPSYEAPAYREPSYARAEEERGPSYAAAEGREPASEESGPGQAGPSAPPPPESSAGRTKRGWIGLRGKMFFLFLVIPVILMAGSGYFSQMQLETLASDITGRSTELVADAGREQLLEKAKDVALQCEIYLRAHPDLKPEDFSYDPEFSQIAVQAVGQTGYTCVIGEELEDRDSIIWAHPNPNLVGIPDTDTLRKALGPYFEEFYNVLKGAFGRNISTGNYMWKDTDGKLREKYMAIAPIKLGEDSEEPLSVLATAYMDEFTQKTVSLRKDAQNMAINTRNINLGILGGAIVIIGLCIIIYGYRLSRNIQYLTEAADRISVGDLEAEVEVRSKDEIGSLADAISRMQDSLRFSIERMRRRR
ncbi:MAG: zinc-ribbon domain-containing protein [Desulfobacteraceae bacterium]|nr:zinc-ribbon domain-containing protein [Desulfobacteraceae bacterium]